MMLDVRHSILFFNQTLHVAASIVQFQVTGYWLMLSAPQEHAMKTFAASVDHLSCKRGEENKYEPTFDILFYWN